MPLTNVNCLKVGSVVELNPEVHGEDFGMPLAGCTPLLMCFCCRYRMAKSCKHCCLQLEQGNCAVLPGQFTSGLLEENRWPVGIGFSNHPMLVRAVKWNVPVQCKI